MPFRRRSRTFEKLRGYVPDGMGAIRYGEAVPEGAIGPLDDDLTLRMILDTEP